MNTLNKTKNWLLRLTITIGIIMATLGLTSAQSADEVFHKFEYKGSGTEGTKIGYVAALPEKPWQDALASAVKMLLNITGALALIAFTAGGVFMIVAHGEPELVEKGKKIMIYSIIGLLIIAGSYALVLGVSQLQFFTPGTSNNSGENTNQQQNVNSPNPGNNTGETTQSTGLTE